MTSDAGFRLHPEAAQDIKEIWQFIAEDNPTAATRFRQDLLEAMRKLTQFPHLGHKRPDLTTRPLRFLTVHNYMICYAPDEKPLPVVAIIHGRRSPRLMAALLRGRE